MLVDSSFSSFGAVTEKALFPMREEQGQKRRRRGRGRGELGEKDTLDGNVREGGEKGELKFHIGDQEEFEKSTRESQ